MRKNLTTRSHLKVILGDQESKDEDPNDEDMLDDDDEEDNVTEEQAERTGETIAQPTKSNKKKKKNIGKTKVTVGPDGKIFYVWVKPLHKFALIDVEQFGKDLMEKNKIVEIRDAMEERKQRENSYLYDRLYDYLKSNDAAESLDLGNWLEADDETELQRVTKLWDARFKKKTVE
jgi:hypothetical protein